MSALEYFFPEDFGGHIGLLIINNETSTLGILREGKPRFIRDISFGVEDMLKRLRFDSNLSLEEFEQLLDKKEIPSSQTATALSESLGGLIRELRISLDYYRDQSDFERPIQKLFVCGSGSFHPIVLETLSVGLGVPVASLDVLPKLKWSDLVNGEELHKHKAFLPIPLGLALRSE